MKNTLVSFWIITITAGVVHANDPKFEFGKPDAAKEGEEPEVEWKATAEAGVVFTTGNAETTTVTAAFKASRKAGKDKVSIEAAAAYASSGLRVLEDLNGNGTVDDESEITTVSTTTAETMAGKLRYDRFLTTHNSLYAAVLASRDVPAGKESVIGGQLGYSRLLYKSKKSELAAEVGYDLSREHLTVGDPIAIHSARGFVGGKSTMSKGVEADASIEVLSNLNEETLPTGKDGSTFKDTRVNGHIGLSAKIGKDLAVQTAIDVKYDHRPGPLAVANLAMGFVPEATKLDTMLKASLIYTFF